MWPHTFLILSTLSVGAFCLGNENCANSPYILEAERLPDNLNFMPTLGNGHLGFTIFSDSIFMNGVFNGKGGLSHRARIPNVANISVTPIDSEGYTRESFKMDLYRGIFERKQSNSEIETVIRTYPHRYFNRAIINEIFVERNLSVSSRGIRFRIDMLPGDHADDFTPISVAGKSDYKGVVFCEQTIEMENPDFQSFKPYICFAMEAWPAYVDLLPNKTTLYRRIVVAIGETAVVATKELNAATSSEDLLQSHIDQWKTFWNEFHIDLDGNLELSRTINAGIFYLASSLPAHRSNQPCAPFYGLSPTGLGRGSLENDYQGHNFWDTEIWMLPPVTQLSPRWARDLLNYRFRKLEAAVDNAKRSGYPGARFPWESAFTGTEVTNPCCPEIAAQQLHITADIAFAVRHYFVVTNDTQWMQSEGCQLATRIAEFWVSRVSLDKKAGQYDIKYVMGPDEDHENVTNNGYTNLVVHHTLEFIHLTQKICGTNPSFAAKCLDIAEKLKVPYDAELDYNPEYEGYTPNIRIKQADAVLLSYPMLFPMNVSTLSNNLKIYEKVTRTSGPAMTWSMHAIGHLDEGNAYDARELFEKGYKDYVREPFKVWSEVIKGKDGAVNFITGVGGFLQAIMNGYGGIRFHSNRMEVRKPTLLPDTKGGIISGIKYQGSIFTIKLSNEPTITADYIASAQTLHFVDLVNKATLMVEGIEYPIETTVFVKAQRNY